MTKICIVRHGETDWNVAGKLQGRTDIPINNTGKLQAADCGEYLKNMQWDVIITSPLNRAKQTAMIINKKINVPIIEMDTFIERGYGDAEGMTLKSRTSSYPDRVYPNQEDRISLNNRITEGLHEINETYPAGNVLLVAHGGVINAILANISNGEIGSGKTKLLNACMSNIQFKQEKWQIVDFNLVTHLTKK
ncbi:histidine phosphatase family protein [Psychrobacillus soli]|uniref:Histidine phosphatase family protein n=1 Tax=Psychrobacillus soli TaxID=1543965 RepID=A0A544TDZ8_9BACI|nr:histidine phosphatase family protein [Psychrobacillus soli]TQR15650.1 histidine phosphatase family protein [Psychrobacillus soli]